MKFLPQKSESGPTGSGVWMASSADPPKQEKHIPILDDPDTEKRETDRWSGIKSSI